MAAYFIDVDNTVLVFGENKFLPGAKEKLIELKRMGHQIFFTTYRNADDYPSYHDMNPRNTEEFLKKNSIEYDGILYKVESPRVIINDGGCFAINHKSGADMDYSLTDCLKEMENL